MSLTSVLGLAVRKLQQVIPSITYIDAVNRITEHTGFGKPENVNQLHKPLSWDSYFMSLAYLVSMRSPDAQTQHGCVIVDKNNRIISTGYNGFLPGCLDSHMPNLRPKKYQHVIHSEVNAVLNAKQDLSGCKSYQTGNPCNECLKVMAMAGIKEIIVGDISHVLADGYLELQSLICAQQEISITKFNGNLAVLDGRKIGS